MRLSNNKKVFLQPVKLARFKSLAKLDYLLKFVTLVKKKLVFLWQKQSINSTPKH